MLDEKSIQIVQSTAPVLKEHSEQIGKRFYELLFSKAPDLYNIFNQTNQKRGIQQEALGYAVYAAGEYITNLEAIKPVIERITQKHRAIGVKAEQYPIVGETLLQAVKDVLGDVATDEIIEAWGKAYGYIADAFIEIEKNLYEETENQAGGWEGFRTFYVDKKVEESKTVTSFYLKPKDAEKIASYTAGQYLTIKAEIPGEKYTHIRHYSLSEAPGKEYYRISVKREDAQTDAPAGIVSTYLHQQVKAGDTLLFSAPAGDFVLQNNERPVILISGGIGITPMLSMLNTIMEKQPQREVTFIHATANSQTHAFKDHVSQLEKEHSNLKSVICYSSPTEDDRTSGHFDKEGFVDMSVLQTSLPSKKADFYFCGPIPFMQVINKTLKQLEIPNEQIHFEVFSPIAMLDE
ncbi:NO-inducible flavohemoprotein [Peribacillus huizhouensis]|uniref:Flavohemoprotein n=1 Tax=Peribacillus huizhouensis TaxID=1501239 RepID=A0ABR6CMG0_9BACI|nr:NO-inducible flavohemoprotein [Peribacillus huizhouensis]MBA9026197.1 nitric oxide dioxygenase [Peribacillus huizhouensis]